MPQPVKAEQLYAMANETRAQAGLRRRQWDPALAEVAMKHCMRMAAEGPIAHRYGGEPDLAERAGAAGAHFSLIEENIAVGSDPGKIHQGGLDSPGHRANLLNPEIDRIGTAVVAAQGVLFAVADYARGVSVMETVQVENQWRPCCAQREWRFGAIRPMPERPATWIAVFHHLSARTLRSLSCGGRARTSIAFRPNLSSGWSQADTVRRKWEAARPAMLRVLLRSIAWRCCFIDVRCLCFREARTTFFPALLDPLRHQLPRTQRTHHAKFALGVTVVTQS